VDKLLKIPKYPDWIVCTKLISELEVGDIFELETNKILAHDLFLKYDIKLSLFQFYLVISKSSMIEVVPVSDLLGHSFQAFKYELQRGIYGIREPEQQWSVNLIHPRSLPSILLAERVWRVKKRRVALY
jgi:hypothetical protein